jgi:hypothetical protein
MKMKKTHLLKIEYALQKNGGEPPRKITLPISPERYAEPLQGATPENKAWREVQTALATIAALQDGHLGKWGVELKIKANKQQTAGGGI